jgi:hypothetical protein
LGGARFFMLLAQSMASNTMNVMLVFFIGSAGGAGVHHHGQAKENAGVQVEDAPVMSGKAYESPWAKMTHMTGWPQVKDDTGHQHDQPAKGQG